jgi:transcriptional regulator EpsA
MLIDREAPKTMRSESAFPAATAAMASQNLSQTDSTMFLAAVADSIGVRRRFQFFSWAQLHLQALLPHGVLVCGVPRGSGTGMFFDYFHNLPLPTSVLASLCHPRDGVAVAMLEAWRDRGADPMLIAAGNPATAALRDRLHDMGLGTTLAHGVPFEQSSVGASGFFAFVSLRDTPGAREMTVASFVVPQLFSTYCRALARDRAPISVVDSASDSALSEREVEILHWVREGKSNHEIGMVLSISPLTVKNHIQRILRKLQANNRTQAVTKAISMRLLRTGLAGESVPAQ